VVDFSHTLTSGGCAGFERDRVSAGRHGRIPPSAVFTCEGVAEASRHPLSPETTAAANVEPGENCHIGSRQKNEKHNIGSTHEPILSRARRRLPVMLVTPT
jgi:hypothetical protein